MNPGVYQKNFFTHTNTFLCHFEAKREILVFGNIVVVKFLRMLASSISPVSTLSVSSVTSNSDHSKPDSLLASDMHNISIDNAYKINIIYAY